jgi:hypothetical protein
MSQPSLRRPWVPASSPGWWALLWRNESPDPSNGTLIDEADWPSANRGDYSSSVTDAA